MQIICYAFPYRLLGFVAHLAIFYGIALSSFNRRPYSYRKPLQHSRRDLPVVFGIIGLTTACAFAAGTMNRCSGARLYMLIAFSKILLTLASSAIGIHIAWNIRGRGGGKEADEQEEVTITHYNTLWWLIIEVVGSILESTAVIMLLRESHDAVAKNRTPMSLFLAGVMGIARGVWITWLEVRQHAQRRMEWEVGKVQTKVHGFGAEARAPTAPGEGGLRIGVRTHRTVTPGPRVPWTAALVGRRAVIVPVDAMRSEMLGASPRPRLAENGILSPRG